MCSCFLDGLQDEYEAEATLHMFVDILHIFQGCTDLHIYVYASLDCPREPGYNARDADP